MPASDDPTRAPADPKGATFGLRLAAAAPAPRKPGRHRGRGDGPLWLDVSEEGGSRDSSWLARLRERTRGAGKTGPGVTKRICIAEGGFEFE